MRVSRGPRVLVATALAVASAICLAVIASPIALASTESGSSAGSSPPTLLIAALGGACLAAVWLLRAPTRPTARRSPDRRARVVAHARKQSDASDR